MKMAVVAPENVINVKELAWIRENVPGTHVPVWQMARETGVRNSSLLNIRSVFYIDTECVSNLSFSNLYSHHMGLLFRIRYLLLLCE